MPKPIAELKDAKTPTKRKGGRKIQFAPIVAQIVQSGQFWSVKEVHEQLVKEQVSRFRTMRLLQTAVAGKRLRVLEDGGKYYYGPPEK